MGSSGPRGVPPLQPGCAQDAAVAPARKVAVVAGGASDEGGRAEDVHQACDHAHAHAHVTMSASMFHVYAHAHVTMSAPMFHAYACGHVTDYEDVGARPLVQAVAASTPQGLQRYPYTGCTRTTITTPGCTPCCAGCPLGAHP